MHMILYLQNAQSDPMVPRVVWFRVFTSYFNQFSPPSVLNLATMVPYKPDIHVAEKQPARFSTQRTNQTKDTKIGICCFNAQHKALRSKSKH
jgi:hypothetical protein